MKKTFLIGILVAVVAAAQLPGFSEALGEDPILVATDASGDGALSGDATFAPLGMDEIGAYIHQPDYGTPEIVFIWQLTDLQLQQPPPEIQRFLWEMTVDGAEYWIVAKTSDLTTATAVADDPTGSVTHVQGAFRLRADCTTTGVATCHHKMWLDGEFDTAAKQVRVRVPLNDPVAPHFKAGAVIVTTAVETGFQIVISQENTTTDSTAGCGEYKIPENGLSYGQDEGCS